MVTQEKFVLKSKTVWGVIIMALPTVLAAFGVSMPEGLDETVNTGVVHGIEFVGFLLAIYGRFSASTAVSIKP